MRIIESQESKELFVPFFESEGAIITLSETLDIYEDELKMKDFDLIVQAMTMGNPTANQLKGLIWIQQLSFQIF